MYQNEDSTIHRREKDFYSRDDYKIPIEFNDPMNSQELLSIGTTSRSNSTCQTKQSLRRIFPQRQNVRVIQQHVPDT